MKPFLLSLGAFVFCTPALFAQTAPAVKADQAKLAEFFETKIRPVFAEHCYACHGPKKQQGGLRLDGKDFALKGGDDGPVIVPGHPEKSPMIQALNHSGDVRMPPRGKLPGEVIADLQTWVKLGAVWPADRSPTTKTDSDDSWKTHWAFQRVQKPTPPQVKAKTWAVNPIDAFVYARLD